MTNLFVLWGRELGVWFHSVSTYVMLALFSAVAGLVFQAAVGDAIGEPLDMAAIMFGPLYFWLLIIALAAVTAMRLYGEERRAGMSEMIMTAPVTEWEIILSKYAGAMAVFTAACLPTAVYPVLLAWLRQPAGAPSVADWAPLAGGFLALFLCGALFNAVGLLCATFLRGPAAAGLAVFVACGLLFVADQSAGAVLGGGAARIAETIAPAPAIRDFARGVLDTRPLAAWISAAVFCLFAAQRTLVLRRVTGRV